MRDKDTTVCVGDINNTLIEVKTTPAFYDNKKIGYNLQIVISPRINNGFHQTIDVYQVSKEDLLKIAAAFTAAAYKAD